MISINDVPAWVRAATCALLSVLSASTVAFAAGADDTPAAAALTEVVTRLARLEQENRQLLEEVRELRKEVSGLRGQATNSDAAPQRAPAAPVDERLRVAETRIQEQAQTKVEASQKFPLRVTGMALFNAYVNGHANGDTNNATVASLAAGRATGGATLRQTILGLNYTGPRTFLGGEISGSVSLDLFGGSTSPLNHVVRLRTATIGIDWKNTSIVVGQEKPLISPRNPESLAQVGVPPLSDAGNLWIWQPQVRVEQRFEFGEDAGLRAQLGIVQTALLGDSGEYGGYLPATTHADGERSLPGLEGRFELWKSWGDNARLEIAPGFHVSRDRVGAFSVPSRVVSLDWLVRPIKQIELSGMVFRGQNVAAAGGLQQGFTILMQTDRVIPVHATGAWAQLRIPATARLAFDIYAGQENDRDADIAAGEIGRNRAFGANTIYRLAPNVLLSLEAAQIRTAYKGIGNRLNNHYDLALAYLF